MAEIANRSVATHRTNVSNMLQELLILYHKLLVGLSFFGFVYNVADIISWKQFQGYIEKTIVVGAVIRH